MRYYLAAFFVTIVFILPWMAQNYPNQLNFAIDSASQFAMVVTHRPKTIAGLQSKYNTPQGISKIKVLIVPGHEMDYGGAEFGDLKERYMTVELANNLSEILQSTGKYQTYVTRTTTAWNPIFADYYNKSWQDIIDWKKSYKEEMSHLISLGTKQREQAEVEHINTPTGPATRLYGLTKWANENDIDMIIHIHFNDYPGHGKYSGKYSGFAIYVPSNQYDNSATTHAIADTVYRRLAKYNASSDLPIEGRGIIDDPELIAVGANNTSDAPSMLIEYGYIYEPQFVNPEVKSIAIKDLAYQTFLGLQDFFDPTNAISLAHSYDTLILPHNWTSSITEKESSSTEVYALQTALLSSGLYPPADHDLNDCPRTGKLGPCTKSALELFQKQNGIIDEKGIVGPKTEEVLNKIFGSQKGK
jgi:N-acetylmuramoyl-L-alanine amidase